MRIIAGTLGGRTLRAPPGTATRPTSDRVREALFSILLARAPAPERVLDLYAGSGALALEALSRGAQAATLVEQDEVTCDVIRTNAQALEVEARCEIVKARVTSWIGKAARATAGSHYGWIFVDPPYAAGELGRCLHRLGETPLVADDTIVIAEHDRHDAPGDRYGTLSRFDERNYGQTVVSFYGKVAGGGEA
jgi:16S rRNA (guanine(966)-N(2))-methyltransferase RsmD